MDHRTNSSLNVSAPAVTTSDGDGYDSIPTALINDKNFDEPEDPLNDLRIHLILAFIVVSLLMLCYLILCINSFLYEISCCPTPRKRRRKYGHDPEKGELKYPIPWDPTLATPNKEYSCSDLKYPDDAPTMDELISCNCEFYYIDDDELNQNASASNSCLRYYGRRTNSCENIDTVDELGDIDTGSLPDKLIDPR